LEHRRWRKFGHRGAAQAAWRDGSINSALQGEKMRCVLPAIILLAVGLITPATAKQKQTSSGPNWDSCYWLGWTRGVHVERGELDDFMGQCLVGKVAFSLGASDLPKRSGWGDTSGSPAYMP
jgi:hypothetical protein